MMGLTHPGVWPLFPASVALPDPDALLDPFCVAAALGPTTELPMGLCVTDATRRRGPDLARAALTLQDACRGGFTLGIGASYEFSVPRAPWINKSSANVRFDRLMIDYSDFRNALLAGQRGFTAGNEPLYKLDANIFQVFVSIWF